MESENRTALFVAHPSHELRIYGWLAQARPRVYVLTNGGGKENDPRIARTGEVVSELGLERGCVWARFADVELYELLLQRRSDLVLALSEELAKDLFESRIELIAGDASEGYNSVHDTARLLIDSAVEIARLRYGWRIRNFDFPVVGHPAECPDELRHEAIWIRLDDVLFDAKLQAVCGYTEQLHDDVAAAVAGERFVGVKRLSEPEIARRDDEVAKRIQKVFEKHLGTGFMQGCELADFRTECLRPVPPWEGRFRIPEEPPFYELYGEELVAAGRYRDVIRYREHMAPIAEAVWAALAEIRGAGERLEAARS